MALDALSHIERIRNDIQGKEAALDNQHWLTSQCAAAFYNMYEAALLKESLQPTSGYVAEPSTMALALQQQASAASLHVELGLAGSRLSAAALASGWVSVLLDTGTVQSGRGCLTHQSMQYKPLTNGQLAELM